MSDTDQKPSRRGLHLTREVSSRGGKTTAAKYGNQLPEKARRGLVMKWLRNTPIDDIEAAIAEAKSA